MRSSFAHGRRLPVMMTSMLGVALVIILSSSLPSADGFAPQPRRISRCSTSSNANVVLSIGADYFEEKTTTDKTMNQQQDRSFEDALGSAHVSEYERDAEFYRKRNEAYSKSLLKDQVPVVLSKKKDNNEPLKASFDHVETSINSLLKGRPLVALGIFCAAGILVAYLSGFFFLEGYIENWNPAENDQIPYWDDAEIHTIQRAPP